DLWFGPIICSQLVLARSPIHSLPLRRWALLFQPGSKCLTGCLQSVEVLFVSQHRCYLHSDLCTLLLWEGLRESCFLFPQQILSSLIPVLSLRISIMSLSRPSSSVFFPDCIIGIRKLPGLS